MTFTIMGILNMTPDSFSDGGSHPNLDAALSHAEQMIREGASIIDVGGESTRPGYTPISWEEEVERIVPVIEALKARFDVKVSVDTYRGKTWEEAIEAGADMLNDIWGLQSDPELGRLTADHGKEAVIMHNRDNFITDNFTETWLKDIEEMILRAKSYGIAEDKIILDPGVGFAKTPEQNLLCMGHLRELCALGYPVLLGTSRKRILGHVTGESQATDRDPATAATSVLGYLQGVQIFRVHNVGQTRQALEVTRAVKEARMKEAETWIE